MLVSAHDVGEVILSVNVANYEVRVVFPDFVAEGVNQVGLAEADTIVDE